MSNSISKSALRIGPTPREGETYVRLQMRWATFAFAWLCLFCFFLGTFFFMADKHPEVAPPTFGLVFFSLFGCATALLATMGFLLKALKSLVLGPNPIYPENPELRLPETTAISTRNLISQPESSVERLAIPVIALTLAGYLSFAVIQSQFRPSLCLAWLWFAFAFFFISRSRQNRRTVWLEGKELIVLDRTGEKRIPIGLIDEVGESRFSRGKIITIIWRESVDTREKITFPAPFDLYQIPFSDHWVVKRLRMLKGESAHSIE